MKTMKKAVYVLIFALVTLSGVVFANREIKDDPKPAKKALSIADKKAAREARKKWEASPDGIHFKRWEASAEGKRVRASHDKIRKNLRDFSEMEAVVTSVTFQRENSNASSPKWLIVNINGDQYMIQYGHKELSS
jgi:hypothetical protein